MRVCARERLATLAGFLKKNRAGARSSRPAVRPVAPRRTGQQDARVVTASWLPLSAIVESDEGGSVALGGSSDFLPPRLGAKLFDGPRWSDDPPGVVLVLEPAGVV
jgi:hypothetical protein